jgi:hypothetical protein
MRVKPYAMRSPSRNARHTALCAPGGCMSMSGCSCRYRSSLGTWSGGPGGTSRTGQYRYQVSGARKGFPKSGAIRWVTSVACWKLFYGVMGGTMEHVLCSCSGAA